jgi:hypothetical protein
MALFLRSNQIQVNSKGLKYKELKTQLLRFNVQSNPLNLFSAV